jgi:hypothetical protein
MDQLSVQFYSKIEGSSMDGSIVIEIWLGQILVTLRTFLELGKLWDGTAKCA